MARVSGFKNEHKIEEDITTVYCKNRKGEQFEVLVDTEDLERIKDIGYSMFCMWYKTNQNYYPVFTKYIKLENGKYRYQTIILHKFLTGATKEYDVDHINHNTLDNRKSNLRVILHKDNVKNRKGKNKNNTSGYRNVSWNKDSKKWVVQMQVNGKNKILGYFEDVHEAGRFAEKMRKEIYGEFAGAS